MTMNMSTVDMNRDYLERAESMLVAGELDQVVALLEGSGDRGALASHLLGVAYFRLEDYGTAADRLQRALAAEPEDKVLKGSIARLLALSRANDVADVRRPVPEPVLLERHNVPSSPEPVSPDAGQGLSEYPKTLASRAASVVGSRRSRCTRS
jgi:hypothetical protein